jgi:hypothetical protein
MKSARAKGMKSASEQHAGTAANPCGILSWMS